MEDDGVVAFVRRTVSMKKYRQRESEVVWSEVPESLELYGDVEKLESIDGMDAAADGARLLDILSFRP